MTSDDELIARVRELAFVPGDEGWKLLDTLARRLEELKILESIRSDVANNSFEDDAVRIARYAMWLGLQSAEDFAKWHGTRSGTALGSKTTPDPYFIQNPKRRRAGDLFRGTDSGSAEDAAPFRRRGRSAGPRQDSYPS